MTDFLNDLSYLVVVFKSYCYFECFCVVNFNLFACIDRMIYLVLCTFVIFFTVLLLLSAFSNTVSVSSAIVTPFFSMMVYL